MHLRILTFNAAIQDVRMLGRSVYRPVPWTGARLRQLAAELAACEADIVCLQELFHFRYQHWLCDTLSRRFPHVVGRVRRGPGLRLGNELLVLSRYPLSGLRIERFHEAPFEERHFTSRGFLGVDVAVPGLEGLRLINVHASAGGMTQHPEAPAMERCRAAQLRQVLAAARRHPLTVLTGDFNAGPHSSTDNYGQVLDAGYVDTWNGRDEAVSWDPANPLVAGGRESHLPPQRIDHVFLSPAVAEMLRTDSAAIVLDSHCADTGSGTAPLSDHYGVQVVLAGR